MAISIVTAIELHPDVRKLYLRRKDKRHDKALHSVNYI